MVTEAHSAQEGVLQVRKDVRGRLRPQGGAGRHGKGRGQGARGRGYRGHGAGSVAQAGEQAGVGEEAGGQAGTCRRWLPQGLTAEEGVLLRWEEDL